MEIIRSFEPVATALISAVVLTTVGCSNPEPQPSADSTTVVPTNSAIVAQDSKTQAAPKAGQATTPPVVHVSAAPAPPTPALMAKLPVLPRPSSAAEVKQRIGVTDFHIEYSSPGAKGREIWGKLLPYGKMWRAGANAPTKLTVNQDFSFGGKAVSAGRYSVFIQPAEKKWKVVLNKDPKNAGVFEHDSKLDVAEVEVEATTSPARERLTYLFEDATKDSGKLVLDWAGRKVAVELKVDTKALVAKNIDDTLKAAWRPLFNAGRYAYDGGDQARATELFEKSIGIHASFWNHWWAAQSLAKQKKFAAARKHAESAQTVGKDDKVFKRAFAKQVTEALASWPKG